MASLSRPFGSTRVGLALGLACGSLLAGCGAAATSPARKVDRRAEALKNGGTGGVAERALDTATTKGGGLTAEAAPQNSVGTDGRPTCVAPARVPRRLWRLTDRQALLTVRAAFADYAAASRLAPPRIGDSADGNYVNQPRTLMLDLPARFPAARAWATETARALLPEIVAKEGCAAGDAACLEKLALKRLPVLWRQPVSAADVARLKGLFQALASTPDIAMETALTAALLTPQFWYRSELGTKVAGAEETYRLTPLELASMISFTLTDAPPDAALFAAAARMTTVDKAIFAEHVERLLADKAAVGDIVANFYGDLFDHESLVGKASTALKADVEAKQGALRSEAAAFVKRLVATDASFGTILSSPEMPISGDTARFYGRNDVTGATRFVASAPGRHAGLLTLPANLITISGNTDDHSFIHRGTAVLSRTLCVSLGAPPADAAANAGRREMVAGLSSREIKLVHSSVAACAGCHKHIDPVGLAFENFALDGSFRATDARGAVDVRGDLLLDGKTLPYGDFPTFLRHVSGSRQVVACGSRKLYEYALGIALGGAGDAACLAEKAIASAKDATGVGPVHALRQALVADETHLRYGKP